MTTTRVENINWHFGRGEHARIRAVGDMTAFGKALIHELEQYQQDFADFTNTLLGYDPLTVSWWWKTWIHFRWRARSARRRFGLWVGGIREEDLE